MRSEREREREREKQRDRQIEETDFEWRALKQFTALQTN